MEENSEKKQKVLAGVCTRLSGYFNIDPVVFRLFFVMLALFWWIGVWLYLILAFFLPDKKKQKDEINS